MCTRTPYNRVRPNLWLYPNNVIPIYLLYPYVVIPWLVEQASLFDGGKINVADLIDVKILPWEPKF